ncbi:MAG: lysophospholipid acyltransferase family protein [Pseudomonadota bacterium]
MIFLRSVVFNIIFYTMTLGAAFVFLPLIPFPRRFLIAAIIRYEHMALWVQEHVLGLRLEITGRENLPANGPYIVAMKHQSAYETLILHALFKDTAIILKRELTWIPIWGWIVASSGNVAIDRGKGRVALDSMLRGAKTVFREGRILTIYPQGTRVDIHDTPKERPYKIGIGRIYTDNAVPVVPIAINAGVFWPKHAFLKRPGVVTFQVLPPIPPGLPLTEFMQVLEQTLEHHSTALVQAALHRDGRLPE